MSNILLLDHEKVPDHQIPLRTHMALRESLFERMQRHYSLQKEATLSLGDLRDEHQRKMYALIGENKVEENLERYKKLIEQFESFPGKHKASPEGEREADEYWQKLKKQKHKLYHELGFDIESAIRIRKEYQEKARVVVDKSLDLELEMPEDDDAEEPRPTSNPWKWYGPNYANVWQNYPYSNGSRGYRDFTQASFTKGEILLESEMSLYGADNSDWSKIDIMAEVVCYFTMPAAGLVEVWIYLQDINTDYSGRIRDESGCSDINVEQLSRAYIWTTGSVERYSTLFHARLDEDDEGSWNKTGSSNPGDNVLKHFHSQKTYAAGELVYVGVGLRDHNYFWTDDMSCRSEMNSQYFVKAVAIRSTGAP